MVALETRFLKQYGARRTGTNVLRSLIASQIQDAWVLMHVLGDKHSPPVDLEAVWKACHASPEAETQFVWRATEHARAETTDLGRPEQAAFVRSIAAGVARCYRQGQLGFMLSVKNPYAWAVSMGKFRGWLSPDPYNFAKDRQAGDVLRRECDDFNRCYGLWLEHHLKHERQSVVVRFEDLLCDGDLVLDSICSTFALTRTECPAASPIGTVLPAHWDQQAAGLHSIPFNSAFYREKGYLSRLSPRLLDVVARQIDWSLMEAFGYDAEPGAKVESPPLDADTRPR